MKSIQLVSSIYLNSLARFGRTVKAITSEKQSEENSISVKEWAIGVYLIRFVNELGINEVKKLVVTH